MTYGEIQDEVLRNVIDLPTAVQEGVPDFVNRAMKTLQGKYNFKVMEKEADYLTVVGQRNLELSGVEQLPTRFKEWRLEPYYVTDDGEWSELIFAPNMTAVRRLIANEEEGAPEILFQNEYTNDDALVTHSVIEVYPLPDGNSDYDDGEYRIAVPYVGYVAPLSADADDNWFTLNAEEWLIFQATAEAFFTDWDENRAAVWTQRAANKFDEVKMLDKRGRLAGVRELVPQWRGARAPFVRR